MKLDKKLKKVNLLYLLKAGIGSAVAILLADLIGLSFSPSAGIITLLTLQNTKKETINVALKRFVAFLIAIMISYVLFESIGYTPIAFGLFVFIFVALCLLFELKDGIAMNAVLMTHLLVMKHIDLSLFMNETGLLLVGMGIGIVINLIMPRNKEKIRKEQIVLEEEFKAALISLAHLLKDKESCLVQKNNTKFRHVEVLNNDGASSSDLNKLDFEKLVILLDKLMISAYEEAGNSLLSDTRYIISYLEMRKLQTGVLKEIRDNIISVPVILRQTYPIAEFIESISASFHERNNVAGLLLELGVLKEHFRKDKLPESRDEFEYRAVLFQILKELEYFLVLKRNFILELEAKNMVSYWE